MAMEQVQKILYTGALGAQPTPRARPAIIVPVGLQHCERVIASSQGFLTRLVVKQTGGTACAAVIELLDSKIPIPPGDATIPFTPLDDIELYRIIPQQSVAAGFALEMTGAAEGYPFLNQDGTFADNQRLIYLVINPTSAADDTTWDVAMTFRRNM